MHLLHFQLVTPERVVLEKDLVSLSCPTMLGQITILPGHAPLIATLSPGEMVAKTASEEFTLSVTGGFVQVDPVRSPQKDTGADAQAHQTSNGVDVQTRVKVLADAAEHDFEIDLTRAEEAKRRAEAVLKRQSQMSEAEYASVAAAMERSLARLKVARKHAHRKVPITGEGVFHE